MPEIHIERTQIIAEIKEGIKTNKTFIKQEKNKNNGAEKESLTKAKENIKESKQLLTRVSKSRKEQGEKYTKINDKLSGVKKAYSKEEQAWNTKKDRELEKYTARVDGTVRNTDTTIQSVNLAIKL